MPTTTEPGVIYPKQRITWLEWALLVVLVGMTGTLIFVQRSTHNAVEVNREVGYKNRAVMCDFIAGSRLVVPAACTDPHVLRYRSR
jgi:hypothetical protein